MNNNQLLGLIGLAMKAGKICFGADSVEEEIKKLYDEVISFETIENLSKAIGKSNKAILGIKDNNFAQSIQKKYNGGDIIG